MTTYYYTVDIINLDILDNIFIVSLLVFTSKPQHFSTFEK